jgi:hypothetical protein
MRIEQKKEDKSEKIALMDLLFCPLEVRQKCS